MTKGIALTEVQDGQELAPLIFEVSYSTLAMDVAGTRDLYPIHHDPDFAKEVGVRNIFLNTMWYQGLIGRYVTDWAGPEAFLRKLSFSMKHNGCPGDTLYVHGTVTQVSPAADRLVDLTIRIDNGDYEGAVVGAAAVEFPPVPDVG